MSAESVEKIRFLVEKFGSNTNVLLVIRHSILSLMLKKDRLVFVDEEANEKKVTIYELLLKPDQKEVSISCGLFDLEDYREEEDKKKMEKSIEDGMAPIIFVRRAEGMMESEVMIVNVEK